MRKTTKQAVKTVDLQATITAASPSEKMRFFQVDKAGTRLAAEFLIERHQEVHLLPLVKGVGYAYEVAVEERFSPGLVSELSTHRHRFRAVTSDGTPV